MISLSTPTWLLFTLLGLASLNTPATAGRCPNIG